MKQLVLVGGGHSHVEVLRRIAARPWPGVELTLISPDRFTPYSGMLPGLVAGHYAFDECHIDLSALAARARARFVTERADRLDLYAKRVRCESGDELSYDLLALDIGSTPPLEGIAGAIEHGLPVKPVDRFLAGWEQIPAVARARAPRILVVGGGAGGIEIALAMQHRLRADGIAGHFCVVSNTETILPGHAAGVRRRMQRVLAARGVVVHLHSRVVAVDEGCVRLGDGRQLPADAVVWATGAAAPAWLRESGLATDERGFVLVNERLQSLSHPDVFASGDVATMAGHPRPKSGVYAVRQGPPLADNLRRALAGETLEPYLPQPVALALISTGDKYAIASWGALAWSGAWVWRWKDRIDRRFMRRYAEFGFP
jgi:selenide,water dikinase